VEKYGTLRQVTDASIMQRMRIACRTIKAKIHTQIHNIYYVLIFDGNNGNANALQYYVIRALLVLL